MRRQTLKRFLAATMCVMMIGLTACGNDGKTDATSATDATQETTTTKPKKEEVVVQSVLRDIEYATTTKEPLSFVGSEAVESELYVKPIEGMTDEFIRGVDISSYIVEKDAGVVYKDFEGNELNDHEFFEFLADCGVNWVRVRVWNDPYDKNGMGYGGGNNDIEKAVVMGKLATDAGMQVLVDFHYSDFWADPAKQMVPKAWDHKTLDDKVTLIGEYTTDCLNMLKDAGVNVGMVQIGNEINNGYAGETEPERMYALMTAASAAVRAVDANIKIAVHYTNPENEGFPDYADILDEYAIDYDVFGTSYYPAWHGTIENLYNQLNTIKTENGKEVAVLETSYLYTWEDGDGFSNNMGQGTVGAAFPYEVSVQGQANEFRDVMEAAFEVGALGVFYWEPAWIPVKPWTEGDTGVYESNMKAWETYGCGWATSYAIEYDKEDAGSWFGGASWDNQAMFGHDGTPLESLNIFKYVFGGTTAENAYSSVSDIEHQSGVGMPIVMPSEVEAIMLDGSKVQTAVTWDQTQLDAIDTVEPGEYTINGTVVAGDKTFEIVCELAILDINYIKNEGFELKMDSWVSSDTAIADAAKDNNKRTGEYSLHFWSENAVIYTVEQKIENIPAGNYELGAWLQGGDNSATDLYELYITVNGERYSGTGTLSGWLNYSQILVKDIVIPEGAEVYVGVNVNAVAKAWGAWDDFTLYNMD